MNDDAQERSWWGRRFVVGPLDARQESLVMDWLSGHMTAVVEIIFRWTRASGAAPTFVLRYFGSVKNHQQLETEMAALLSDDRDLDDFGMDVALVLAERLDAGDFGNLEALRRMVRKAYPVGSLHLATAIFQYCIRYAPAGLDEPAPEAPEAPTGDAPPEAPLASLAEPAPIVLSAAAGMGKSQFAFAPEIELPVRRRPKRPLTWSRFYLGLDPLPQRPRPADSNDEGSSRPAATRALRRLFPKKAPADARGLTRLLGVVPLVAAKTNPTLLTVAFAKSNDCVRLSPAGHAMLLGEDLRNRHILTVGQTGAGKTTRWILPLVYADIRDRGKSVIILDCKGELAGPVAEMTRRFRGHDPLYLDFRDPARSLGWNPIAMVRTKGDARELALRICTAVEDGRTSGDSRFFLYSSVDLLTGIIVGLFVDPNYSPTLAHALAVTDLSVKEFETFASRHAVPELKRFAAYIATASHNAETVLADLRMRLGIWRDERVCATTSTHELFLANLARTPSVLLIHIGEQDVDLLKPLTNAFMTSLFGTLLTESGNQPAKMLAVPVSLIIEEFASAVGRIPELERRLNTIRQRRISVTASIQSLSQIQLEYGQASQPLLAGFSTKVYFPNLTQEDAEFVSRSSGAMTIVKTETSTYTDKVVGDGLGSDEPASRVTERLCRRAVFTPDEVTGAAPSHRALGRAVTCEMADLPMFQAFLTPVYRFPKFGDLLAKAQSKPDAVPQRAEPLAYLPPQIALPAPAVEASAITDASGWSDEQVRTQLSQVKRRLNAGCPAESAAYQWWEEFQAERQNNPKEILWLAEHLMFHAVTIAEFYQARVASSATTIQVNLDYLRFSRSLAQEKARQSALPHQDSPSAGGADLCDWDQVGDDDFGDVFDDLFDDLDDDANELSASDKGHTERKQAVKRSGQTWSRRKARRRRGRRPSRGARRPAVDKDASSNTDDQSPRDKKEPFGRSTSK